MSKIVEQVRLLIRTGEIRISEHGYDELMEDDLTAKELISGVAKAVVVEEYPDYPKGHASYSCRKTGRAILFMLCGVSPRAMISQWFWLRHTGRTQRSGVKII